MYERTNITPKSKLSLFIANNCLIYTFRVVIYIRSHLPEMFLLKIYVSPPTPQKTNTSQRVWYGISKSQTHLVNKPLWKFTFKPNVLYVLLMLLIMHNTVAGVVVGKLVHTWLRLALKHILLYIIYLSLHLSVYQKHRVKVRQACVFGI